MSDEVVVIKWLSNIIFATDFHGYVIWYWLKVSQIAITSCGRFIGSLFQNCRCVLRMWENKRWLL